MTDNGIRTCTGCGERKSVSKFYRVAKDSDAFRPRCRACTDDQALQYRKKNRVAIRDLNRSYRARYPERQRAAQRRYTESHGPERTARSRAWRAEDPRRNRAHALVDAAIRRGTLVRPKCCSGCGREAVIHAHHDDYAKPLVVRWLCASCHRFLHNKAAE